VGSKFATARSVARGAAKSDNDADETITGRRVDSSSMQSKKIAVLAAAASLALIAAAPGCNNNKKPADEETTSSKFKLLNGSTSDKQKATATAGPEPELNIETRFAAARLAETQNRLDAAAQQYEQALKLKPDHVPSLYRLGIVHTKRKQFDDAAAVWRKYIKATGEHAGGYSNLGFCYEMAGDIGNAEKAYMEGIRRDPRSVPCRTNYGLMLARSGRIPEAEAQLSFVLKPDQVRYNLATVYEQKGEMAQAKKELEKAIEINPKNKEAQTRLANMPLD
jgi:tetratricopeptide (TPR) repeat protein